MADNETFLDVSIWRDQDGDGHFETYQVPRRANQTIHDVVAWVQQQVDPTLLYRFACRVGMFGSCAMMGNEARVDGGPVALEAALRRATAKATSAVPLRPNRVHPLWRTDHDNNVGIGAPEIEYGFEPGGDWIDLTTVHKGGLFGTDYRMLFPSDGIQGIKRFFLDSLVAFGKRGLACQPAIIGIGLGGSKDACM